MDNRFLWFCLGSFLIVALSCTSMRGFNPVTGEFSAETEIVPIWDIDEREDEILRVLEEHGRVIVIRVKEENPMVQWVFGGGLAIGGILILLGIAFVWMTKGTRLVDGLCISGAGLTTFVVFYLIDAYLIWISIVSGVALVGSLLYIFIYKKDLIERLIRSFEVQKNAHFVDRESEVRAMQGSKQATIAKIRKRILK